MSGCHPVSAQSNMVLLGWLQNDLKENLSPRLGERHRVTAERLDQCPTVPVCFRRDDLTQPETSLPVLGFEYITDDHPSFDWA
jgi:hypothetical protein